MVYGCSLLIRRDLFEEVGGFDERFFLSCEEMDLCYRLKTRGNQNFIVPGTQIIHYGDRTNAQRGAISSIHKYQDFLKYRRKHDGAVLTAICKAKLLFSLLYRIVGISSLWVFARRRTAGAQAQELKKILRVVSIVVRNEGTA